MLSCSLLVQMVNVTRSGSRKDIVMAKSDW
jgi:hypothetical protein